MFEDKCRKKKIVFIAAAVGLWVTYRFGAVGKRVGKVWEDCGKIVSFP